MEGAEADEPLSLAAQVRVGGDDLDDVGGVADALDRLRGEAAHHPKNAVPGKRAPLDRELPHERRGSEPGLLREGEAPERGDAEPVRHPGHVVGDLLEAVVASRPGPAASARGASR